MALVMIEQADGLGGARERPDGAGRGEVERLLRTERVADRAKTVAMHVGLACQEIDGAAGVVEHLGHAGDSRVATSECVDRRGQVLPANALPEETAGAERDVAATGQV